MTGFIIHKIYRLSHLDERWRLRSFGHWLTVDTVDLGLLALIQITLLGAPLLATHVSRRIQASVMLVGYLLHTDRQELQIGNNGVAADFGDGKTSALRHPSIYVDVRNLPLTSMTTNRTIPRNMARLLSSHGQKWVTGVKMKSDLSIEPDQPPKKVKALLAAEDYEESENSCPSGGISIGSIMNGADDSFTVNQDFARRFEHNKKREELHKRTLRLALSWPTC